MNLRSRVSLCCCFKVILIETWRGFRSIVHPSEVKNLDPEQWERRPVLQRCLQPHQEWELEQLHSFPSTMTIPQFPTLPTLQNHLLWRQSENQVHGLYLYAFTSITLPFLLTMGNPLLWTLALLLFWKAQHISSLLFSALSVTPGCVSCLCPSPCLCPLPQRHPPFPPLQPSTK